MKPKPEPKPSYTTLQRQTRKLKADLSAARKSALEHCRRADAAEAAVGENCRMIARLTLQLDQAYTAYLVQYNRVAYHFSPYLAP